MRILTGILVLTLGLSIGYATTSGAAQGKMSESDYQALMKQVGPTNGAMQKAIKSNMLADAAKSAQQLATLFGDVEKFWTQYKIKEAMTWAAEARKLAAETASAAGAGDQMKAMQAATNLLADCKQCHGMFREGSQETGFRIKPGVLGAE